MKISRGNIERYSQHFNTAHHPPETVFTDVLEFGLERQTREFSIEDFEKYLYVEDERLRRVHDRILFNLNSGKQYQIIHGYAKNGKSTLLRVLVHRHNNDPVTRGRYKIVTFDFNQPITVHRSLISGDSPLLADSINFFLKTFLVGGPNKVRAKLSTLNAFIDFVKGLKDRLSEEYDTDGAQPLEWVNTFNSYFLGYLDGLHGIVGRLCRRLEDRFEAIEGLVSESRTRVVEILSKDGVHSSDLFCFLVFFHIFENRNRVFHSNSNMTGMDQRNKLVFILDNIDDIKSDMAIDIGTNYTYYLCDFLSNLRNVIRDDIPGLSIRDDIAVIFTFRTANFLNSLSNHNHALSMRERRSDVSFYNSEKIRTNTTKMSHDILLKRITFFKKLMAHVHREGFVKKDPNIRFFENLILTITRSQDDSKNGFRFWNGNRNAFISSLSRNKRFLKEKYFDNDNLAVFFDRNTHPYLRRGLFIYFFLDLLREDKLQNIDTCINDILEYRVHIETRRINFRRLMITYIVNRSIANRYERAEVSSRGVGFYTLIREFLSIRNTEGHPLFSKEEIQEFFEVIFRQEIDHWGHLFSCFKSTVRHEGAVRVQGKFLDFTEEFDQIGDENSTNRLNAIRIFNNDNADYFINHVQPHFEQYSISMNNRCPLPLALERAEDGRYEFEAFIERVFVRVEACVDAICTSYLEYFSERLPPLDFCLSPFSMNDSFYFGEMISKHVTYLNQFRVALLNDQFNLDLSVEEKVHYNEVLTKTIQKYLDLFFEALGRFEDAGLSVQGTCLESISVSFRSLQAICYRIRHQENYRNFGTSIRNA